MIFRFFKEKKLATQIWIILGLILGIFSVLLTLFVPTVLRYSFTKETYARLEDHQEFIIKYQNEFFADQGFTSGLKPFFPFSPSGEEKPKRLPFPHPEENANHPPLSFRIIEHLFLDTKGNIQKEIGRKNVSLDFIEALRGNIKKQRLKKKRYQTKIDQEIYFYVISSIELAGKEGYLVSYLEGKYRDNLVADVFFKIIQVIGVTLIISWIASIFIARNLTKPLTQLQQNVKVIAEKNWNHSVILERGDEIGQLSETIDWMREQLVEYNKKQQSFLQEVSHELKTPVMVIKSYVQSINDGIFPKDSLENSLEVIAEETVRLEKRVHFLLGHTKYEYLSKHQVKEIEFNLAELIRKTVSNFKWRSLDIDWKIDLEPTIINGDKEKLRIALENLLDNQVRYAKSVIAIKLAKSEVLPGKDVENNLLYTLKIWNDGPEIEEDNLENIFKKYKKGYEGSFGLGLAIVKLIVELHNGSIWVNNEDNGVAFYIQIKE
ncbi:MAG: HAMP domain-containing histidine kinase [Firmicutes bacterium]|nr:HAMP domain-containing histidine kinase [Bacillota bacterium]